MKKLTRILIVLSLLAILASVITISAFAAATVEQVAITVDPPTIGKQFPIPSIPKGLGCSIVNKQFYFTTEIGGMQYDDDVPREGELYYLVVDLRLDEGYTFSDNIQITVNGAPAESVEMLHWGDLQVKYAYSFLYPIAMPELTFTEPAPGTAKSDFNLQITSRNFTVTKNVTDITGEPDRDFKTFQEGHIYELEGFLKVKRSYTFPENAVISLNGMPVETTYVDRSNLRFTCYFSLGTPIEAIDFPAFPENVQVGAQLPQPELETYETYTVSAQWINARTGAAATVAEAGNIYNLVYTAEPAAGFEFSEDLQVTQSGFPAYANTANQRQATLIRAYSFGVSSIPKVSLMLPQPGKGEPIPEITNGSANCAVTDATWFLEAQDGSQQIAVTLDYRNSYRISVSLEAAEGFAFTNDTVMELNGDAVQAVIRNLGDRMVATISYGVFLPPENGWAAEDGTLAYYENGVALSSQWVERGNGQVYLDENGKMAKEKIIRLDNGAYYVDGNGYPVKDRWEFCSRTWYYFDEQGLMVTNAWKQDSTGWCYLNENGASVVSKLITVDGELYYIDEKGHRMENFKYHHGKYVYYFGPDGAAVKNTWQLIDGKWSYFDENGRLVTNNWVRDSKGWCFVDDYGCLVTNSWIYDSVAIYHVGADGYMSASEWIYDGYGWCYAGSSGAIVFNKWVKDSVGWCYIGADGYMVTNKWVKDSKGWCYVDTNGYMATNKWVKDSVGWCYVGYDGYCKTNCWQRDSKGWCYLDAQGRMVINGWQLYQGSWYYMDGNGYMLANTSRVIGGKRYYFNASGVCTNP